MDEKENGEWQELMDKVVFKKVLKEGKGLKPEYKQYVAVHLIGRIGSTQKIFLDTYSEAPKKPLEFPIGDMLLNHVDHGVMLALKTMKQGEISAVKVNSRFAFGTNGLKNLTGKVLVPPDTDVEYRVELVQIGELEKTAGEMNQTEFEEYVNRYKNRGNEFFHLTELEKAERCYKQSVKLCESFQSAFNKYDDLGVNTLHASSLSNLAAVYEKQEKILEAIEMCTKVHVISPSNIKNLLRIVRLSVRHGDYKEASLAMAQAEKLEAQNKTVQQHRKDLTNAIESYKSKRAKMFSGFLNKNGSVEVSLTSSSAEKEDDKSGPVQNKVVLRLFSYRYFLNLIVLLLPVLLALVYISFKA